MSVCRPTRLLLQLCQLCTAVLWCCVHLRGAAAAPAAGVHAVMCRRRKGTHKPASTCVVQGLAVSTAGLHVVGSVRYKATTRTCGQDAAEEKAPEAPATHPVLLTVPLLLRLRGCQVRMDMDKQQQVQSGIVEKHRGNQRKRQLCIPLGDGCVDWF